MNSKSFNGQVSILTLLLSSSVLLAVITGVLYLVGGAYFEASVAVLGLNLLNLHLQPGEYIFAGAEALLGASYVLLWFFGASLAVSIAEIWALLQQRRVPRKWETQAFAVLIILPNIAIYLGTRTNYRTITTGGACPIVGHVSLDFPLFLFCSVVVCASIGLFFFEPKPFKVMAVAWGFVAGLLSLYCLGGALGANKIYDQFEVIQVNGPSLPVPAGSNLLVLGRDDKKLVVLKHDGHHAQPTYLSRSDVKTLKIVGSASINDFVCKAPVP